MQALLTGALAGALAGFAVATFLFTRRENPALAFARAARQLLPRRIILVRHGESQGNTDSSLYRSKADNLIELTPRGCDQATAAGERIKAILGDQRAHLVVSPFERTLQTARYLRSAIEDNLIHTYVEPRVREQEFGNLQDDEFSRYRAEQQRVGRFFYRFPTGESGADVYGRTKQWLDTFVCSVNLRPGVEHADALVVVTHGLTMRLVLMAMYGWSPNTFSTIWNAGNCEHFVLKLDETKAGNLPYSLDKDEGAVPRSALDVLVSFRDGSTETLRLDDYLALAPPRSTRTAEAARMLAKQHGRDAASIESIDFFACRAGFNPNVVSPPSSVRRLSLDVLALGWDSSVSLREELPAS